MRTAAAISDTFGAVRRAWTPWLILAVFVFLWGTPQVRASLDGIWFEKMPVVGLHELVQRVPPVVAAPHAESAIYNLNLLSATGTGILIAAILSGLFLGYSSPNATGAVLAISDPPPNEESGGIRAQSALQRSEQQACRSQLRLQKMRRAKKQ